MTAKPKTGKAIMTDEEILNKYYSNGKIHASPCMDCGSVECAVCSTDALKLMAQARQQGIAEGGAEMFEQGEKLNRTMATMLGERCSEQVKKAEKQAYEKGVADGKAEEKVNLQKKSYQQLKFYDSGYEQGVADIKARLTSGKVVMNMNKWRHTKDGSPHYGLIIEQALAEAERK
jgi:hypothetical protein